MLQIHKQNRAQIASSVGESHTKVRAVGEEKGKIPKRLSKNRAIPKRIKQSVPTECDIVYKGDVTILGTTRNKQTSTPQVVIGSMGYQPFLSTESTDTVRSVLFAL